MEHGSATEGGSASWVDAELAACDLGDRRLVERLRHLLGQLGRAIGQPLPLACQDWAGTKAAYRFFSNERFGEDAILSGHFAATAARCAACEGPLLVVQDTTELIYKWGKPDVLGAIGPAQTGRDRGGKPRMYTQCGLLMHSGLVVTPEGLPLGLVTAKLWTRSKFKGTNALKRQVNPTRVPIESKESMRWLSGLEAATTLIGTPDRLVHVGDREADIFEFFCLGARLGTHFLVRTCVDRLAVDGKRTVGKVMADVVPAGTHTVEVTAENGAVSTAELELRFARVRVLPPIGKQKRYPALELSILHAREIAEPQGRARLEWKLVTDLPVVTIDDAVEKLRWYACRWKIELFHKVLKSGCRAEAARLRTADRLAKLIAVLSVVAWRCFWTTMVARSTVQVPAVVALTAEEISTLDSAVPGIATVTPSRTLAAYLLKVARLGGYLARSHDPPPGITVMWRGWARLADIMLGAKLANRRCG